jgi:hypothetical protein
MRLRLPEDSSSSGCRLGDRKMRPSPVIRNRRRIRLRRPLSTAPRRRTILTSEFLRGDAPMIQASRHRTRRQVSGTGAS